MSGAFKAVIFDCDGVLVDSEPVYAASFAVTLLAHGCALPESLLREELQGMCLADCYRWLARNWGFTVTSGFEQSLARNTDALIPGRLKPIAEVGLILEELACPMAVASNGRRNAVLKNLQLCELAGYFGRHIYTSSEVACPKPAPDVYLHVARQLGVQAGECLVIEDSVLGVEAAIAAGMTVCWFGGSADKPNEGIPNRFRGVQRALNMQQVQQWLRQNLSHGAALYAAAP